MRKTVVAVLILLTFTMGLSAQGRRGGGPPQGDGIRQPPQGAGMGQPPDPTASLKAMLGLTDAQVDAVKALQQTRQTAVQAIQAEIGQKRQALDTLLDASNPNATEVGNAAIALRASEKKVAAEQTAFLAELKKLLTGTQQQTLDELIASRTPIPGIGPGGGMRGMRGPRGN